MTLAHIVGLFNIIVGLMLTTSILLMGGAIIMWITRFGTWPSYRTEAIHLMIISVTILFVLVVLLTVAQFVQQHTAAAAFIFGLVLIALIIWLVAISVQPAEKEEGDERRRR